jgi:hypothetical protein
MIEKQRYYDDNYNNNKCVKLINMLCIGCKDLPSFKRKTLRVGYADLSHKQMNVASTVERRGMKAKDKGRHCPGCFTSNDKGKERKHSELDGISNW